MPPRGRAPHIRRPPLGVAGTTGAFLALAAAAAGIAGCATPVVLTAGLTMAQAGTSAFISGELVSARQVDLDRAWAATLDALDELAFDVQLARPPDEPQRQGLSAYVAAKDEGGPRVRVKLERASDAVTRIKIRVDVLGDQALSRLVLSRIDARLPPPPPVNGSGGGAEWADQLERDDVRSLEPHDWLEEFAG